MDNLELCKKLFHAATMMVDTDDDAEEIANEIMEMSFLDLVDYVSIIIGEEMKIDPEEAKQIKMHDLLNFIFN